MVRFISLGSIIVLALMGMITAGVFAQGSPPPPDATPGAVGFKGAILGGVDPVAAPGFRLEMRESIWEPGAYVTSHFHPVAIVVCVQSGELGFAIQAGAATVSRGGTEGTPESVEPLAVGAEVILEPRDCVTFDEYAVHTSHTAWNASDGPTVLWETAVLEIGATYTTFLDAQGTPVP